ncbi:MAG: nucleoside 2-deoxyribosyltransferase [Candidatus Bathyarchaeia archaeon]
MKKKVFISGPIQGFEDKQSYRTAIREICINCGCEVFDPWEREKIIYKSEESGWWEKVSTAGFIKRDLEDIERCDVLIAYMPTLSAGTCMELFYAKLKGKTTICICQLKNPSPWITFHSDIIIKNIEDLKNALGDALKRNAF